MRIEIVTTRHISYNPRVVKEADALTAAGHDVAVSAIKNDRYQHLLDEELLSERTWRIEVVDYQQKNLRGKFVWAWTGIRQKVFQKISRNRFFSCGIAERAQGREYPELCKLTCRHKADLYIAHHAEALGAAYRAAKKFKGKFAFDAEDFHTGQLPEGEAPQQVARIEYLESKYLPQCDYITAASDGIAEAYQQKYSLKSCPTTILNVFPLEPLPNRSQLTINYSLPIRLYWYSQVIGPGRGLEDAVQALGMIDQPCELHLRGKLFKDFGNQLRQMAEEAGVEDRLFFHKPVPPQDLIQLAAEYDIGLALEMADNHNRLICVTNKIFVYMMAGLAVVATNTPGQRGIMEQAPGIGEMCRMSSPESLAEAIEKFLSVPEILEKAKRASRKAAGERFNWEMERRKLIRVVEECVGRKVKG